MNAATTYAVRTRPWRWQHNPGQHRVELVNSKGLVLAWLIDEADTPQAREAAFEQTYRLMFGRYR